MVDFEFSRLVVLGLSIAALGVWLSNYRLLLRQQCRRSMWYGRIALLLSWVVNVGLMSAVIL